jgi:PAS domain-containing protein
MAEASPTRTPETRLFRDVFNASPIGIAVEYLEGQPLFVNPPLVIPDRWVMSTTINGI